MKNSVLVTMLFGFGVLSAFGAGCAAGPAEADAPGQAEENADGDSAEGTDSSSAAATSVIGKRCTGTNTCGANRRCTTDEGVCNSQKPPPGTIGPAVCWGNCNKICYEDADCGKGLHCSTGKEQICETLGQLQVCTGTCRKN